MTYERKDAHYRRAKAAGYRARSAYKLIDLDDRHHLLRKGDRVIDLGAWPGGWCQVAAERVGPSGRVVGIDLVAIAPLPAKNVQLLLGDVRDTGVAATRTASAGGLADVVLSDLAPKLTGVRDVDEVRLTEAVSAVMAMLTSILKPGGRALLKLFMSSAYAQQLASLRRLFRTVKTTRSEASRRGSAELYVIAEGFGASSTACG